MPTQKLTQNSFVNGQYDRTAQNQESLQGGLVSNGLSYAKNIVSGDKQEARKRLGTKKIFDLQDYAVIAPYRYNESDVLLLFSNDKIEIYNVDENVFTPFVGATDLKKFEQEWTSNNTNGYKISSSSNSSDVYKIFNGYANGKAIGAVNNGYYIVFEAPENISINHVDFHFNSNDISSRKGGYLGFQSARLYWSDDGIVWNKSESKITKPDGSAGVYKYEEEQPAYPLTLKKWNIKFSVVANIPETHKYWKIVFDDFIDGDYDETLVYNFHADFWTQTVKSSSSYETSIKTDELKNIKYAQYAENFKFVTENSSVYNFCIKNGVVELQKFEPKVTGEERKIFSIYGTPSCVSYFQNRLWFSGFKDYPALVLGSKFGDENTFTASATLAFDDYFNLTCNQLRSKIKNIIGSQNILYCFSQDGISFVDSGSNAILASNQSIEFHLKNRMPAGDATPTFKDDVLLYASADGTKLYAVDYDMLVERFNVEDLSKYAKDITNGKIKELHYLNNKSQLVYGLCEDNTMFALLYRKGLYNGFFSIEIQNGFVYDICPIKTSQDYKLFMVTYRAGRWYLEEKLDEGEYIDTSSVLLSKEEKKWATYDNIENNIALDCYKTYENAVDGDINVDGDVAKTTVDLEKYVGQTVMFAQENSKDFLQAEIEKINKEKLYAWSAGTEDKKYYYTKYTDGTDIDVYDERGNVVGTGTINLGVMLFVDGEATSFARDKDSDKDIQTSVSIKKLAQRGNSNYYNTILFPFDSFETDFSAGTEIGVISQGRYLGEFIVPDDGVIQLPFAVQKITYGATYLARGIIKIQQPYESMKQVQQVAVSVLNTGHLEIGTSLSDMLELEKIKDDSHLDLTTITMNGSYVLVPSDTPEWEKNIIFQSKKGLSFTVNCIEAIINYSNMGGK